MAARARRWAGEVFRYAIATARGTDDPATVLRGALKVGQTRHYPALRREEMGALQRALLECPGRPETRLALQMLLLTFVRPGELRAAPWAEFNLDASAWRIPAERMKARAAHIVRLSQQAIAGLEELQFLTGHSAHLFPGGHKRVPYMSDKVGAAYHRAEYLAEQTKLMQFWANELDRLVLGAEVVQLPQRA